MVKIDLFPEEVYTFTPRGKVMSFRTGATPIDFAYAIHTEVGHQCAGAKVNGRIVPLKYPLRNGDIVEILTQPNRHPSRDWLGIAKTSRARSKIRAWLNANERASSTALGRELTDKEFRRYKKTLKQFGDDGLRAALSKLGFADLDDFYAAVGYGKSTPQSLLSSLVPENDLEEKQEGVVRRAVKRALGRGSRAVMVSGMDDMMISLAKCCSPVRGEEIIGYISRGKGVSVHSVHCPNVTQLMYDSERKIDVEWSAGKDGVTLFDIKLLIDVADRPGMLAKITSAIAEENIDIRHIDADTYETAEAKIEVVLSVTDRKHMERIMARIGRIKGVHDVERIRS
jgi:GTP pyrophosphokinase